jgi:hypothetical protein
MRSRTARFGVAAPAWIAIAGAAFFLLQAERQLARERADFSTLEALATAATNLLTDLRTAQQAYVATGQGAAAWIPKVAKGIESAGRAITALHESANGISARASLDESSEALTTFAAIDKRARDYLRSDQALMAGDVIFTEGRDALAAAGAAINRARHAEQASLEAAETGVRRQEALALAAAAGLSAFSILLLVGRREETPQELVVAATPIEQNTAPAPAVSAEKLAALTHICQEFGRVREISAIEPLMPRLADTLDAKGIMIWLEEPDRSALRPRLVHGYAPSLVNRMPSVPRSGDNAAANAYRSGALQMVNRQDSSPGAIVAPILSGDGCIGVLSAEFTDGQEAVPAVQAVASILAAQCAAILRNQPRSQQLEYGADRAAASL